MSQRKNVIVFGGAGFIGSHLCERLLKDANVICIDNFSSSGEGNINHLLRSPNFRFINHDFTEPIQLENNSDIAQFNVKVFGIKEIYNFACPMSVNNFDKLKSNIIKAQTVGLINALDLAIKYQAKFLQASSSVVYGQIEEDTFIKEDYRGKMDMLSDLAAYDEGKRYAETVVKTYQEIHNLDARIVRIFRTYGSRMLLGDGQMLPDFISNALDNKDLVIHGDENFKSSFCYVSDIVEACLKVMETPILDPVNIGSTEVYRLVDIAKKIIELTSSESKIVFKEEKIFMRKLALPDITKIREEIGWVPIVTMNEGLQKTVDYTRAHKDLLTFSTDI